MFFTSTNKQYMTIYTIHYLFMKNKIVCTYITLFILDFLL